MQIEMTIKGLMIDPITNMPIIILRDQDGQRILPIWVGVFEANAIALQIENVQTPRPMTHDLLKNVIDDLRRPGRAHRGLRAEGEHVLRDASTCARTAAPSTVDARPSDAIALALRTRSPIFVEEAVIQSARSVESQQGDHGRRPPPEVARGPLRRGARQVQDVSVPHSWSLSPPQPLLCLTSAAADDLPTRCRPFPASPCHSAEARVDRHRHRQSEGRRGQDHDRHQPRRGPGHARPHARCSSTSTRRPTRRSRYLDVRTRRALDVRRARRTATRRSPTSSMPSPVPNLDIAPVAHRAWPSSRSQLVGELDAHFRLKDRLGHRGRPLRLRGDRHAAGAGPHHRQRAGGGHAPADSRAVELLRARGHGRSAGDGGEDPLAARTRT